MEGAERGLLKVCFSSRAFLGRQLLVISWTLPSLVLFVLSAPPLLPAGSRHHPGGPVPDHPLPSSLQVPGTTQEALYLTGRVAGINTQILLEIRLMPSVPGVDVSFKSERPDLATLAFEAVAQILA